MRLALRGILVISIVGGLIATSKINALPLNQGTSLHNVAHFQSTHPQIKLKSNGKVDGDAHNNGESEKHITIRAACKNSAWKTNLSEKFKNQGNCVSFFASNGKNESND